MSLPVIAGQHESQLKSQGAVVFTGWFNDRPRAVLFDDQTEKLLLTSTAIVATVATLLVITEEQ